MSVPSPQISSPSLGSSSPELAPSLVGALLRRLLGPLQDGGLVVGLPGGNRLVFEGRRPGAVARLDIRSWRVLGRLISSWDLGFAEAYMAGEWSSPNLGALLEFAGHNCDAVSKFDFLRMRRLALKIHHALNRNTRHNSRRNIAAHYDLGNAFYALWLDAGMTYSSGLYTGAAQSLDDAQAAKLDRVLDLLDLRGGERVLEIGCGWGGFAERLLRKHDCNVTGVTLSAEQLEYARRRLDKDVAGGRCELLYRDYRDVDGTFDRIVSIEMMEAVGEAYWPTYFAKLRDSLRPGGTAVLQVITIDEARFENYRRRPDFIQKYIFPGGMLPTARIIEREAHKSGLQLTVSEFFGDGYARTLESWRCRFKNAWPRIKALGFDDQFERMWEYYLAYCQVGFESRALNVGLFKLVRGHPASV